MSAFRAPCEPDFRLSFFSFRLFPVWFRFDLVLRVFIDTSISAATRTMLAPSSSPSDTRHNPSIVGIRMHSNTLIASMSRVSCSPPAAPRHIHAASTHSSTRLSTCSSTLSALSAEHAWLHTSPSSSSACLSVRPCAQVIRHARASRARQAHPRCRSPARAVLPGAFGRCCVARPLSLHLLAPLLPAWPRTPTARKLAAMFKLCQRRPAWTGPTHLPPLPHHHAPTRPRARTVCANPIVAMAHVLALRAESRPRLACSARAIRGACGSGLVLGPTHAAAYSCRRFCARWHVGIVCFAPLPAAS